MAAGTAAGERDVGLVRVSTARQGQSRLGLEAGLADPRRYAGARGATLLTVLEEIEIGTHDDLIDRPTLLKALALCRRHRATLLIPKVDRLVRSTIVHADIKRSGVPFRAVYNTHANEFTLDILVAVAAREARAIGDRTRRALAVYKSEKRVSNRIKSMYPDGVPPEVVARTAGKLGSHPVGCRLTAADRAKGRARANHRQRREAAEVHADLVEEMGRWRAEGMSLRRIAARLNAEGQTTRTGTSWTTMRVSRVLRRAGV